MKVGRWEIDFDINWVGFCGFVFALTSYEKHPYLAFAALVVVGLTSMRIRRYDAPSSEKTE